MEAILVSEVLYKSPAFHEVVRKKLISCTDCIISQCKASSLDPCVESCMEPCTTFKSNYESRRLEILESLKNTMLRECLNSPTQETCVKTVVSSHVSQISAVFASYS